MTRDDADGARRRAVRARPRARPRTCSPTLESCSAARGDADARSSREVDRARRATGIGPTFPISGYDDLTAAQVSERLDDLIAAGAAQGARLRAPQREPQVGAAARSSASSAERACHPGAVAAHHRVRPPRAAATSSSCTVDSLAYGGNGVARLERLRRLRRRRACPATASARVVSKRKRAYAEARTVEIARARRPTASPPVADHPGAPWQVLPYERQLEVKARAGRRRAARASASSTASSSSRSSPRSSSGATATSSSTRSAPATTASWCAASTRPGRWDEIVADRRLPARLRARQRRCASRCSPWCRARRACGAWDRRDAARASCATSSSARAAAPASCRCASSPRPASSTPTRSIDAVDADGLFWTQTAGLGETHRGRRDRRCCRGAPQLARGARRPALPDLARGVLPDQHRDGRACSTASPASTPALRGCERVFDLYCGIGTIGLSLRRARARGRRASRSSSRRSPTRSRTRARNEIANARFFAGDVRLAMRELVERAGSPDVVVIDPPRAGLSQKVVRRIIEAAPEADRLRLLQPDDARAERRAARRGRLRAAQRVRPVDMFPQTPHIECVALLERA